MNHVLFLRAESEIGIACGGRVTCSSGPRLRSNGGALCHRLQEERNDTLEVHLELGHARLAGVCVS